ncbi:MAG: energy-coupling factor transporter transmembrane component T [Dehalococcoidales bacterium]|nr:energy-coupling factor transporter transmembrane component T [Dehalococcoidales bacterium]
MRSFRYRDRGTPVHSLNPFAKLAWLGSIIVLTLILDHPFFLILLFVATLPVVKVARVWREWRSSMRITAYLCGAIILINALVSSNGSSVIYTFPFQMPVMGTPVITLEAIFYGMAMSLRLLAIISAFAILTFTVHPDDLMLAMIKVKLPYKSVLVTSLSTRFIPTLIDDTQRITDVQRSRGLDLDKGKFTRRLRSRASIVTALLSNSLDRAVQVAEAMESRAFGTGRGRTFYRDIRMTRTDTATVVFAFLPLAFGVYMAASGYGQYIYYPTMQPPDMGFTAWALFALMAVLLLMILPLAYLKRRVDLD